MGSSENYLEETKEEEIRETITDTKNKVMDEIEIIFKGEVNKVDRPLNKLERYQKDINLLKECIKKATMTFNGLKGNNKEIDIEFVTSLCPAILSLIYTTIRFSKNIREFTTVEKVELTIIVVHEVVFNYYLNKKKSDVLIDSDSKLINFIFSDEGKITFKSICNASITVFNDIDENQDDDITCSEIKKCCCSFSKWKKFLCFICQNNKK
jgi:hypothetical protein